MPVWFIFGDTNPWELILILLMLNTTVAIFNILMRHVIRSD